MTFPINDVAVGTRHRRDMGDIDGLAASITKVGLLHPIVIRVDGTLIAGERRLVACKKLGWVQIPVTVVDLDDIVRGELAENAIRKDFLPSEIEAIRRALAEKVATPEGRPKTSETFASLDRGRTSDKIGAFAGVSGRQVEKIATVIAAAEADPERFGNLPAIMDKGKVNAAYAKVARHKKHVKIAQAAVVPDLSVGPFPLIYADPPWKFETYSEQGLGKTPDQHYPTMTDEEIGAYLNNLAAKDAALFLWCTSSNLKRALWVVEQWGFEYKTHAVWDKEITGQGLVFRNQHEVLIYGTRGNMPGPQYQPSSVFRYKRGLHSAKPPEIRAEIEKMYPDFDRSTRIELFARGAVDGWTTWGFEAGDKVA